MIHNCLDSHLERLFNEEEKGMKKLSMLLVSMIGLLVLSTASYAADLTIGVVDYNKVLAANSTVKTESSKLQEQFNPQKNKIMDFQKKLQQSIKNFNEGKDKMPACAKASNINTPGIIGRPGKWPAKNGSLCVRFL